MRQHKSVTFYYRSSIADELQMVVRIHVCSLARQTSIKYLLIEHTETTSTDSQLNDTFYLAFYLAFYLRATIYNGHFKLIFYSFCRFYFLHFLFRSIKLTWKQNSCNFFNISNDAVKNVINKYRENQYKWRRYVYA